MSFLAWIALAGGLMLGMALSSTYLRRLPVTSSGIYLALGLAISPAWLNLIEIDFVRQSVFFEHLTGIAVIVSLFVGGLKLRLPMTHQAWSAAYRLAGPVMVATIAGVAVLAHYGFGLDWPAAFLLGSVLSPTDPVLAGMVTVNDAGDQDRMRYVTSDSAAELKHPTKAAGHMVAEIISFGDTAERLLEMMMVVLLGICLATCWDWRAVPLAVGLFVVVRPLSTLLFLVRSPTRMSQRWLMGWFGIRGIGSLYYLGYALNHGLDTDPAPLVGITLSVVALSVTVHGITSPVLEFYEKAVSRAKLRKTRRALQTIANPEA